MRRRLDRYSLATLRSRQGRNDEAAQLLREVAGGDSNGIDAGFVTLAQETFDVDAGTAGGAREAGK